MWFLTLAKDSSEVAFLGLTPTNPWLFGIKKPFSVFCFVMLSIMRNEIWKMKQKKRWQTLDFLHSWSGKVILTRYIFCFFWIMFSRTRSRNLTFKNILSYKKWRLSWCVIHLKESSLSFFAKILIAFVSARAMLHKSGMFLRDNRSIVTLILLTINTFFMLLILEPSFKFCIIFSISGLFIASRLFRRYVFLFYCLVVTFLRFSFPFFSSS